MKKIYITQSRMPDPQRFFQLCDACFERQWITNNGALVQQLERELQRWLGIDFLLACNNGTTALMLALHCAGLAGKKVAVTPYSYVATLSALLWLGCAPVFVDVEPGSLCLSPDLLQQRLREQPDIAGVLPVHVYGMACDVEGLEAICRERGIPLVYDAAQAFGSRYKGKSLLDYGDYSICSFHATKIFHTTEGGCVVAHSPQALRELSLARAFGHVNDEHYSLGINGKLSELHAAMGLMLLEGTAEEIRRRGKLHDLYMALLDGLPLERPTLRDGLEWNNAYYPVLLSDGTIREQVEKALARRNIHPRRYFYPALNTLPYLREEWRTACPVAEGAAERVLCLPAYGQMEEETVVLIAETLASTLGREA